jgi:predicted TPR repeat methyltransferase
MVYPIAEHYERTADAFDRARRGKFEERPWLDRFVQSLPPGARVLDLGCGAGEPIGRHVIDKGFELTGIDICDRMVALARTRFPRHRWFRADMRRVGVDGKFHGVLAWDAFYHLHQSDQANMLERIALWLEPGGALLFNTEPAEDERLHRDHYHESLDPGGYRILFEALGLSEIAFEPKDANCSGRDVWLVRKS